MSGLPSGNLWQFAIDSMIFPVVFLVCLPGRVVHREPTAPSLLGWAMAEFLAIPATVFSAKNLGLLSGKQKQFAR